MVILRRCILSSHFAFPGAYHTCRFGVSYIEWRIAWRLRCRCRTCTYLLAFCDVIAKNTGLELRHGFRIFELISGTAHDRKRTEENVKASRRAQSGGKNSHNNKRATAAGVETQVPRVLAFQSQ